ncbi:MAG: porin [Lentisphaerae bacterium]|nr:porin [Lentisphaerota bacterium]
MKRWLSALAAIGFAVTGARGGAVIKIDEQASIDVGFTVQAIGLASESDRDGDGKFEPDTDFKIRRARFRTTATLTERVVASVQTDIGAGSSGGGYDARLIDAWVLFKLDELFNIYAGENMAPASRQNLASTAALLTMDYPGMNNKTLTWGTRSSAKFMFETFGDSDAGLRGEVDVRDLGVTFAGNRSFGEDLHAKYYAGAYDGIQKTTRDNLRYCGRVQFNVGDSEPDYYTKSTYLGKKKTLGVGFSADYQADVAYSEDKGNVDYSFYTADVFAECPAGPGAVSFEAGYETLDLGGATMLDHDGDPLTAARDATRAEGRGVYTQAGYLYRKVQPWAGWERWESEADDDKGSYTMYRLGVTYYIKGFNANIKAGFEQLVADEKIGSTEEDTIESFAVGCYMTY